MRKISVVMALLILLVSLFACTPVTPITELTDGLLMVHFIDVGQGDGILLKFPDGRAALVDAGETDNGEAVRDYVRSLGISSFAFVVGTHPHSDHIGGIPTVLGSLRSERLYLPDTIATTKVFEKLMDAAGTSGAENLIPSVGEYIEGDATTDFSIKVLAPGGKDYKSVNNYSIVLYVRYGETSFLLTGDAENESEQEMLQSAFMLDADVLKVGHHGSSTASSEEFLAAVTPTYAAISCGQGNDYGHPNKETLARFKSIGAAVFRTDQLGTIVFTSDGETVTVDKPVPGDTSAGAAYVGNKNSKIFHTSECGSLPGEKNRVSFATREAAIAAGYTPCRSCKP